MARKTKEPAHASDPAMVIDAWAQAYRATARRDTYRLLTARLRDLGLDAVNAPEVIENTIRRVALVCAHETLDGRSEQSDFLRLQTYDAARSGARYLLRFEPSEIAFLLVNELRQIDLVDLFNTPPGFIHLYVDHVDGTDFTREELADLDEAIQHDFYFDYGEDEIPLEIETSVAGVVVNVCEADEEPPWR